MFKAAQVAFYSAALNCVKDVPLRDPAQVALEVDRLGEDGTNRPITTGSTSTDMTAPHLTRLKVHCILVIMQSASQSECIVRSFEAGCR